MLIALGLNSNSHCHGISSLLFCFVYIFKRHLHSIYLHLELSAVQASSSASAQWNPKTLWLSLINHNYLLNFSITFFCTVKGYSVLCLLFSTVLVSCQSKQNLTSSLALQDFKMCTTFRSRETSIILWDFARRRINMKCCYKLGEGLPNQKKCSLSLESLNFTCCFSPGSQLLRMLK